MISGWRWRRSIVSAGRHMLVVVFIIIRCAAIFRHLMVSCCWHCCRYRLVCRLGFTDGGDMAAQDNCLQHICRAKDTKLPIWAAKSFVWAGAAPARGRRQAAFSLLAPLIVDACSDCSACFELALATMYLRSATQQNQPCLWSSMRSTPSVVATPR
jgi:hypothetical protein